MRATEAIPAGSYFLRNWFNLSEILIPTPFQKQDIIKDFKEQDELVQ